MTGIALVMALAAGAAAVGESITPLQARAKFAAARRLGESRHTLKLSLLVNPSYLLDVHDPAEHDLFVSLGGTTLCDVPAGSEGYRVRRSRWRFKGAAVGGRVKVRCDSLDGRMTIQLRRADLHELRDGNGTDVPLVIDVGGVRIDGSVSADVRDGHVKRWIRLATPRGSGGGGAGGGGGGGAGPVSFSTLREGTESSMWPKNPRVARNQSEWDAIWAQHDLYYGRPQPSPDFARDMVICVFLGLPTKPRSTGMTNTIRVVSVTDTATARVVVWEEVPDALPWICPPRGPGLPFAPCLMPDPYHFVLAPQTTLPVTFREQ